MHGGARDEKRDETIAFRAPERVAAWLRDRARVLNITPSSLLCEIVTGFLSESQQGLRFSGFANISENDSKALMDAASAIERLRSIGMIPAGSRTERRQRRTA